jgi:hypothetical protein
MLGPGEYATDLAIRYINMTSQGILTQEMVEYASATSKAEMSKALRTLIWAIIFHLLNTGPLMMLRYSLMVIPTFIYCIGTSDSWEVSEPSSSG